MAIYREFSVNTFFFLVDDLADISEKFCDFLSASLWEGESDRKEEKSERSSVCYSRHESTKGRRDVSGKRREKLHRQRHKIEKMIEKIGSNQTGSEMRSRSPLFSSALSCSTHYKTSRD